MPEFPCPKFDEPPVIEVVCGAQYDTREPIRIPHLGIYWQMIRDEFPDLEEAPPLSRIVEQFAPAAVQVEFSNLPPMPRIWLQSQERRTLIQLQRDRFLYNWKRIEADSSYPSFENVFGAFKDRFGDFRRFVESEGLGPLTISQFELTYVNHIPWNEGWQSIGGVLKDHRIETVNDRFLQVPEAFQWKTQYVLPDQTGRLHVSAQTAVRLGPQLEPILRLDLTARGIGTDSSETGMQHWFAVAHEWIVKGFADLTTEEMHKQWRRTS